MAVELSVIVSYNELLNDISCALDGGALKGEHRVVALQRDLIRLIHRTDDRTGD
jgi:hypothetical protein